MIRFLSARFLPVAIALGVSSLLMIPIASYAAESAGYYAATPVATPSRTMLITSGTIWKWQQTSYVADKGPQRPTIMCQLVAQHLGKLSAFSVAGQPLDALALDKCNAHAKE